MAPFFRESKSLLFCVVLTVSFYLSLHALLSTIACCESFLFIPTPIQKHLPVLYSFQSNTIPLVKFSDSILDTVSFQSLKQNQNQNQKRKYHHCNRRFNTKIQMSSSREFDNNSKKEEAKTVVTQQVAKGRKTIDKEYEITSPFGNEMKQIFFIETGFGCDQHGQNVCMYLSLSLYLSALCIYG